MPKKINHEIKIVITNPEAIEKAKERLTEFVYLAYKDSLIANKNTK